MAIVKTLIVKGVARFLTDAYMSTIRSGIWNGSTIQVGYGGTGVTSAKGSLYTPVFLSSSGIAPCSAEIPHATKDFKINGKTYAVFTNSTESNPTIYAPTGLAGTGGYILATNAAKNGFDWVAANNHTHSLYVLLDSGTAEQTIKSSISSLGNGVIELWRAVASGYPMIGFANGTTKTHLGKLGFGAEANKPIFRNTSNTDYLLAHAGNITTPSDTSVTWNTEKTIATIAGVEVKIKIPSNPNTWRNIYTGGTSRVGTGTGTKAINFASSNLTINYLAAGTDTGQSGSADYFTIKLDAKNWTGATSSAAGTAGYMPGAASADRTKFLRGDGSWVALSLTDHTHSVKINGSTKTIAAPGGTAVDLGNYIPLTGANYNTATDTNPFRFSREGTTALAMAVMVNDNRTLFLYTNDETSSNIVFQLINTDTESSDGSRASDRNVTISSSNSGIGMYVGGSLVAHAGNISNKAATIGTSLTTIATIAGVDITAKIGSYAASNHTHSVTINGSEKTIAAPGGTAVNLGTYLPWFLEASLDADTAAVGWHDVKKGITHAAHTNHSTLIYANNLGTPYQLQIPDSSILYIYKRWYLSGAWSSWSKMNAGAADTWTTARTLTIGNTGKSVNGSADVSWSLAEIGVNTPEQLAKVSKSLKVDTWTDMGAVSTYTGTYAIQISSGNVYASGIFTACGGTDSVIDEIPLHVADKGTNTWRPYARIKAGQLQMTTNEATGTSREYTIKILKLI